MTLPENQKDLAVQLLDVARKTGPGDAEVYLLSKTSLAVASKKGRIDQVRRNDELGAALRIVDQGKMGFAYTTDFSPTAMQRTADLAAQAAKVADREEHLILPDPPKFPWPDIPGPDPNADKVTDQDRFDRALALESSALEFDSRIERVRQAEYRETVFSVFLCNSHGLASDYSGAVFSAGLNVKAADGADAEIGHEGDFSKFFDKLDVRRIGREAARRAVDALGGRQASTGVVPVVFEKQVVAGLLNLLSSAFLADQVSKGKSRLAGRLGQKIMSEHITLVDDGLHPDGLATSPADGEGLPAQSTVLVEKGILKSYLYDLTQARKDNAVPTGNSTRSGFKAPPSIGTTNLILSKGTKGLTDLYNGIDQGLLATDVMGLHTANPISGDFSVGVSGQWIDNGQISHPVKGMALAGNLWDMVEHIIGIGSDFRLFGSVGAASVLVDRLTLSGNGA
jgi:PmbA protein